MDHSKAKKGLLLKTWERCRSMGANRKSRPPPITPISGVAVAAALPKTKSWPRSPFGGHGGERVRRRVAPEGCLWVCVGLEKERFAIKMEYVNHPLFRMVLDEAETEYGYSHEGPLELPCDVDFFRRLLWEMEQDQLQEEEDFICCTATPTRRRPTPGCNFAGGYRLLSPARPPIMFRV